MDATVFLVTSLFFFSGNAPFLPTEEPSQPLIVASQPFAEVDLSGTNQSLPAIQEPLISEPSVDVPTELKNEEAIPTLPSEPVANSEMELPLNNPPLVAHDLESLDVIDPDFAAESPQEILFPESDFPEFSDEPDFDEQSPIDVMPVEMPIENLSKEFEQESVVPSPNDLLPNAAPITDEAPQEAILQSESPTDSIPQDVPPALDVPAEPIPAAPIPETPISNIENPADQPSVDETPALQLPVEAPLVESPAPVLETSEVAPIDNIPAAESPIETAPVESTPIQEVPAEQTPATRDETSLVEVQPTLQIEDPAKLESQQPAVPAAENLEDRQLGSTAEPVAQPVATQPAIEQPVVETPAAIEPVTSVPAAESSPVEESPKVESTPAESVVSEVTTPIVPESNASQSIAPAPVTGEPIPQPTEPIGGLTAPVIPGNEATPANEGIKLPERQFPEPEMHCPYSGACTRYSTYR